MISDQTRFRAYSREYAEVEPVILAFRDYRKVQADLEGAQALLKDSDPELRDLAEEEVAEARGRLAALGDSLQRMLLPKDPNDSRNVFWRSVPAPVATRRRSSPATCSACIRATPSARAGGSRRCRRTRASTVATRK